MKIRGRLGEQDVVVLIDSGATHNFIFNKVVDWLGLCLMDTGSFGVVMGRGGQWAGRHDARHGHNTCPYSTARQEHVSAKHASRVPCRA